MKQRKSYVLTSLEEYIILLHSARSAYDILNQTRLSTSMLYEIRRQFGLKTYKEALEKYIEIIINDSIHPSEYEALCDFLMEYGFESRIKLIPDEELRIKYLKRMNNQHAKAQVLASISDDEMKLEFSKGLDDENNRRYVYSSLSTDEKREGCLRKLSDYHKQAELVATFDDDDLKIEYIFSGMIHTSGIAIIVASLKDDKKKEELLDLIPSDTARLRVILSIEDSEIKRRLYDEKLISDTFKTKNNAKLIRSYPLVEQLQHFSEYSDGLKFMILRDCDFETQLRLLPEISDSYKKEDILSSMPPEFIFKYMADHYADTDNFWVRTDSEEREANVPRDDREQIVTEIVKHSSIPDERKVALIHAYIKNKQKVRELLKEMPYDFVISKYFMVKDKIIDIGMLDQIQNVYDIESLEDVTFTASRSFDFDLSENKELVERVKNMRYPKFSLTDMPYQEYKKWSKIFEGSDVILVAENINISGECLTVEELERLSEITKYVTVDDKFMTDINRYCQAVELCREIFPVGEDEKYDLVRTEIEIHLTSSGQIGATLVAAKKAFVEAGFSDEEIQVYGERLVAGLYNFDKNKYLKLRFAFDEEAIELLHEWDATKSILQNDLLALTPEMTRAAIKRAIEISSEEGIVTEEFAVGHILDYLAGKNISDEGLEYAKKIALELLQKQSLKVQDIERLNPGAYSDVFEIGDFVLKMGVERKTKALPTHPRILPSILRFDVKKEDGVPGAFIEVQPKVVPITSIPGEDGDGNEVDLYSVFSDLRSQGILWADVAKRNLGYIPVQTQLESNLFSELKMQLDMDDSVTIYHLAESPEWLKSSNDINNPYLMVIDTDFLYVLDEISGLESVEVPSFFSMEFEAQYIQNAKLQSKEFKSKKAKRVKDLEGQIEEICH